MELITQIVLVK